MGERGETTIAFGPVGRGGRALPVLGILVRSRVVAAMLWLAGVVAEGTVAELG